MTLSHSPKIVTDGLVLYLDAASPRSYPGSGSSWYDLTSDVAGTLNNGAVYNSADKGSISFDDTNDYVRIERSDLNGGSFAYPNITCNLWVNPDDSSNFGGSSYNNLITVESSFEIGIGNTSDGFSAVSYASTPWAWIGPSASVVKNNSWNMITFVHATVGRWVYVNGQQAIYSGYTGVISAGTSSYPYLTLMARNAGTNSNAGGKLSIVQLYNRVLSLNEIKQNFEALRGRYGI